MPDSVVQEIWGAIPTVFYFVLGLLLFGVGAWLMEKVTPFSIRKEIEEDQNTALAILMGSVFIGLALIITAAIK